MRKLLGVAAMAAVFVATIAAASNDTRLPKDRRYVGLRGFEGTADAVSVELDALTRRNRKDTVGIDVSGPIAPDVSGIYTTHGSGRRRRRDYVRPLGVVTYRARLVDHGAFGKQVGDATVTARWEGEDLRAFKLRYARRRRPRTGPRVTTLGMADVTSFSVGPLPTD